jgi:hypothetical protein
MSGSRSRSALLKRELLMKEIALKALKWKRGFLSVTSANLLMSTKLIKRKPFEFIAASVLKAGGIIGGSR